MKTLFSVLLSLTIAIVFGQSEGIIAYSITPPNDNNEIYLINADGTGKTQLTFHEGRDLGPAWSPDAQKIAFYVHSPDETQWSIFVMDSNGGNMQQLTDLEDTFDNSPTWSPDGTKIVFAREYPLQNYISEIWIMDANGNNQHQIASVIGNGPKWSHVNNQIVYSSANTGNAEIYTMNPDGTDIQQLTFTNSDNVWPAWTTDGEQILFVSDRDGNYEIYIMAADGFNQERLTENNALDYRPDCSPDGTQIAFVSGRDGHFEIYIMNIDGSNQERLTYSSVHAIQPSWRPETTIGIDDENKTGDSGNPGLFHVFPNPAKDFICIEPARDLKDDCYVEIFDLCGNEVISTVYDFGSPKIKLSGIKSGVYLVKVSSLKNSSTQKIIVN